MEPSQSPAANKPNAQTPSSEPQPVAFDQQGRPLYAAPPTANASPQTVYFSRPLEPAKPHISDDVQRRAEESHRKYPQLNLSDGEFVISAVQRHPIGIVKIWFAVLILMGVFGAVFGMFFLGSNVTSSLSAVGVADDPDTLRGLAVALLGILYMLFVAGGIIATYIYNANRFYLTNESVIQEIQQGIFNRHEQTVSLSNIEDASYRQDGIIPHMLDYGMIRLSTEGDETTYRFNYVANPKQHIATLNNAVESFKNGRPVH